MILNEIRTHNGAIWIIGGRISVKVSCLTFITRKQLKSREMKIFELLIDYKYIICKNVIHEC